MRTSTSFPTLASFGCLQNEKVNHTIKNILVIIFWQMLLYTRGWDRQMNKAGLLEHSDPQCPHPKAMSTSQDLSELSKMTGAIAEPNKCPVKVISLSPSGPHSHPQSFLHGFKTIILGRLQLWSQNHKAEVKALKEQKCLFEQVAVTSGPPKLFPLLLKLFFSVHDSPHFPLSISSSTLPPGCWGYEPKQRACQRPQAAIKWDMLEGRKDAGKGGMWFRLQGEVAWQWRSLEGSKEEIVEFKWAGNILTHSQFELQHDSKN